MERSELVAELQGVVREQGAAALRVAELKAQRQEIEAQLANLNPSRFTVTEREVLERAARFAPTDDAAMIRTMLGLP